MQLPPGGSQTRSVLWKAHRWGARRGALGSTPELCQHLGAKALKADAMPPSPPAFCVEEKKGC